MRAITLSLLLLLCQAFAYAGEPATILISAEGSVKSQPDAAIIRLNTQSSELEADKAMKRVDQRIKKLLQKLTHYSIKQGSLDSSQVSIQPEYNYKTKPRTLIAYNAHREVSFHLIDLSQLEQLISDISKLDSIAINNVSFTMQDMSSLENKALINAINTAKEKASLIAENLNVDIKGIYKVNHQVRHGQPVYARLNAEMDMAKSNTYMQKDIDVRTTINIEFELD